MDCLTIFLFGLSFFLVGCSNNSDLAEAAANSPPTLTSISPSGGPSTGGTEVTLIGTGFVNNGASGTNDVTFDRKTSTIITTMSDTGIMVTAPSSGSTSNVSVTVTNSNGTTDSLEYTYNPNSPPTLTSISPSGGPSTGGTVVTLIGTGFVNNGASGTNAVTFDGQTGTIITTMSDTEIMVTSPAFPGGSKDVKVTNINGESNTMIFTYGE